MSVPKEFVECMRAEWPTLKQDAPEMATFDQFVVAAWKFSPGATWRAAIEAAKAVADRYRAKSLHMVGCDAGIPKEIAAAIAKLAEGEEEP